MKFKKKCSWSQSLALFIHNRQNCCQEFHQLIQLKKGLFWLSVVAQNVGTA